MKRFIFQIFAVVALLTVGVAPAFGRPLHVNVLFSSYDGLVGIPDAEVVLERQGEPADVPMRQTTDLNGQVRLDLSSLEEGSYELSASLPGALPVSIGPLALHELAALDQPIQLLVSSVATSATVIMFSEPPPRKRRLAVEVLHELPEGLVPLRGAEVTVRKLGDDAGRPRRRATRRRGEAIFRLKPKASYEIVVTHPAYLPVRIGPLVIGRLIYVIEPLRVRMIAPPP